MKDNIIPSYSKEAQAKASIYKETVNKAIDWIKETGEIEGHSLTFYMNGEDSSIIINKGGKTVKIFKYKKAPVTIGLLVADMTGDEMVVHESYKLTDNGFEKIEETIENQSDIDKKIEDFIEKHNGKDKL